MEFVEKNEAMAKMITPNGKVVTVIGTEEIRNNFESECLKQALVMADAPGVDSFVLNADAHVGYGAPIGSVFACKDRVYPNAVGPDIKCSMSFLQMNLPSEEFNDKKLRRAIIDAIEDRIPFGPGSHMPTKARPVTADVLSKVAIEGASREVLQMLNIPSQWIDKCEDASHGQEDQWALQNRFEYLAFHASPILEKLKQIGGVGSGNHFQSVDEVNIIPGQEDAAKSFGLKHKHIGILNHFGSRGFGYFLVEGGKGWKGQFRELASHFEKWDIPFPGGDKHNVYCPVGTKEFDNYINDMYLGSNFATVNHLLVCTYILEAFKEVMGESITGDLVYYIAHNIIRREIVDKSPSWVHRKGATRALYAGHHELKDTPFYTTGHPILLPGNPIDGSTIMVAQRGSKKALHSVNHGAGRAMSRRAAKTSFIQRDVNAHFEQADILTNCRQYPLDEASGAYKKYAPVIDSVEKAGLALTVAKLRPRILLKDSDQSAETSA